MTLSLGTSGVRWKNATDTITNTITNAAAIGGILKGTFSGILYEYNPKTGKVVAPSKPVSGYYQVTRKANLAPL